MLLRYASGPFGMSVRVLSTSTQRASAQVAEASKWQDYYQKIGEVDETRPPNWDSAKPFDEIPGPKPLPIIGNIWRFLPVIGEYCEMPLYEMFKRFQEQYGNVVMLKGIPGRYDYVHLFDVEDFEHLSKNTGIFPVRQTMDAFVHYRSVRNDLFQDVGGLVTVQGEDWFKVRTLVNPIIMRSRSINKYIPKLEDVALDMVKNIRHFSRISENNQMPDDFIYELYKWGLESVCILALNKRLGCLDLSAPEDSEPIRLVKAHQLMNTHFYLMDMQIPLWKYVSTPLYRRFIKNMDFLTGVIMKNINEAAKIPIDDSIPEEDLSVLKRLLKKDKRIAFAMSMDMMLGGLDSTGKTLGAILYFLSRHPDKQAKLRKEILTYLPDRSIPVTSQVLAKFHYLKAVVKESNRIAPVAVGSPRTTVKDLVLGGYQIPKGTNVTTLPIMTSNSSKYFKDPEKYIPERWLRDNNDEYSARDVNPFVSQPFGYGPRACVGRTFASLELEMMITHIMRNFELTWEHPDMEFASYFLYSVNKPLKITVKEI